MLSSRFQKGHITWNKGTKGLTGRNKTTFKKGMLPHNKKDDIKKYCKCGKIFFVKPSLDRVKSCSRSCAKKGLPSGIKGKKLSSLSKLKMRFAKLGRSGPSHWNYRGYNGRTDRNIEMSRDRYILWRRFIFELDNYSCQLCGIRNVYLEADHINPWSKYPEDRYKFTNGRTLCKPCHKQTPTYGGKVRSYETKIN